MTKRFISFYGIRSDPTITYNFDNNESEKEQQKTEEMTMVTKECMNLNWVHVSEGSTMMKAIQQELLKETDAPFQQDQKDEQEHQKQDLEGKNIEMALRKWHDIYINSCTGRVDLLLQTILKCHVSTLRVMAYEYQEDHGLGLCQGLPLNTSLTELHLDSFKFTKVQIETLKQAFDEQYLQKQQEQQQNNVVGRNNYIRELSLSGCTFGPGSQAILGDVINRHMTNLRSFELTGSYSKPLRDEDITDFLGSLIFSKKLPATELSDEKDTSSTVQNLTIHKIQGDSMTKTMSIIARWLKNSENTTINPHRNADAISENTMSPRRSLSLHEFSGTGDDGGGGTNEGIFHWGDEFLTSLAECQLERFEFSRFQRVCPNEFPKFVSALNRCQQYLKVLSLRHCDFSSNQHVTTMVAFLSSLGGSSSNDSSPSSSSFSSSSSPPSFYGDRAGEGACLLSELNLESCNLNDACLIALSGQLPFLPKLKTLILDGNQKFSEDCITSMFLPALNKSTGIETLYMVVNTFWTRRKIRFICDANKGGRRFFKYESNKQRKKGTTCASTLPYKLWPLIFHPLCTNALSLSNGIKTSDQEMMITSGEMREDLIFFIGNGDRAERLERIHMIRRTAVLYHLLSNGALIDCIAQQQQTNKNNRIE